MENTESIGAALGVWEVLNSPFVIAVLIFGFGGILANWLAAQWQFRMKRYEVKLRAYDRFQDLTRQWIKASGAHSQDRKEMALINMEIVFLLTLFGHDKTRRDIANLLQALRDARESGEPLTEEVSDKIASSYAEAMLSIATELGMKFPE